MTEKLWKLVTPQVQIKCLRLREMRNTFVCSEIAEVDVPVDDIKAKLPKSTAGNKTQWPFKRFECPKQT